MNLGSLPTEDRLHLCRRAAAAVVRRLRLLLGRADPEDEPLRRLLQDLILDEDRQLTELGRIGDPALQGPKDLDALVAEFFPSLGNGTGGGRVDREAGSYFAECLEEESARFYRALAETAADDESRAFFRRAGEARESRLRFVRTVLL